VTTTGTAPAGSSVVFSATNNSDRIGAGDAQILTLKGYLGYKITALTVNVSSNKNDGAGTLSYSVDGGTSYTYLIGTSSTGVPFNNAAWNGSYTQAYVDVTKSPLDIVCGASDVIIRIKGTENSLYCRSYTLTYTTGTITPVSNVSLDKSSATITCGGTETLTPTVLPVDASNKLVTWTSSNALVASVEDGVVTANALGTATITATTVDQEFTASCEVTVTEDASRPVLTGVLLEEDFSDDYWSLKNRGWQCSEHGDISVGGGGYKLGDSSSGGSLVTPALSAEAGTALLTFKVGGYKPGEQAIYLSGTNCTLSPTSFTDLSTTLESKEVTVTFTGANPKITFETRGTAYRAIVDDIVVTMSGNTVDVTLNASGFASYYSRYALDLTPTTSLTAYTVKAIGGTAIKLTKINGKVAARTPFILYNPDAPSTTVNIPVIADDDSGIAAVTDNALVGTTSPTYVEAASGYTNFGLSGSKFVGMNDGVVRANKAYLPVSNEVLGTAAHAFDIVITDPTAISTVAADSPAAGACYTLSGLRVANPTRGLYIVNGRKVIVK